MNFNQLITRLTDLERRFSIGEIKPQGFHQQIRLLLPKYDGKFYEHDFSDLRQLIRCVRPEYQWHVIRALTTTYRIRFSEQALVQLCFDSRCHPRVLGLLFDHGKLLDPDIDYPAMVHQMLIHQHSNMIRLIEPHLLDIDCMPCATYQHMEDIVNLLNEYKKRASRDLAQLLEFKLQRCSACRNLLQTMRIKPSLDAVRMCRTYRINLSTSWQHIFFSKHLTEAHIDALLEHIQVSYHSGLSDKVSLALRHR